MANALTKSLVEAVAKSGAQATVIVIERNGAPSDVMDGGEVILPNGFHKSNEPPVILGSAVPINNDASVAVSAEMEKMRQDYERQLLALRTQKSSLEAELSSAQELLQNQPVTVTSSGTVSSDTTGSGFSINGTDQPTNGTSVDEFNTDVLGLSDRAYKRCVKAGFTTVGKLREAYLGQDLKETKLTKDELIEIGEKLLGKVPAERIPAVPSSEPVEDSTTDCPKGHTDRPWMKRLNVLLVKKSQRAEHNEALTKFEKDNSKFVKRWTDDHENYAKLKAESRIAQGQVIAILYALGLDQSKSVDEAFKEANLSHLLSGS